MTFAPGPARASGWVCGVLLACGALVLTPAPAASGVPAPCAPGTPVAGDYDGDGSPDLQVTVRDNWVDDARHFVSPNRTNQGGWLDIDAQHLRAADLNSDVCADVLAVSPQFALTLVFGTPSGLDPATAEPVDLPQQVANPDRVVFDAIASTHAGIAQVVVAGRVWRDAANTSESPFVDVFTLAADGTPGEARVIDAGAFVPDAASLAGWPGAMAADDGIVVVGNAADAVGGKAGAGAVRVFTRAAGDPSRLELSATISQATPGVPGTAEPGDGLGQAVALRDGRLAVGVPRETTGGVAQAGRVQLFRWDPATAAFRPGRSLDQNTPGVPGTNERNDRFGGVLAIARGLTGAGSYDVVVGVPNEDAGTIRSAGAVTVASFTSSTAHTFTQDSRGVPGTVERAASEATADGEYFGAAVGTLPTSPTVDTLVIGAPGETNGECLTQGYVTMTDGRRLASSTRWTYLAPPTSGCSYYDGDVFDGWGRGFALGSSYAVELT